MFKMKSFGLAKFLVLIFVVVISIDGIRANSLFNLEEMLIKGMTDALERMDNAIYEMNNRITRLENMVGMDGSNSDKNGQTVKTEPKTADISLTLRETKRNFIKAMSVEKQILRDSMHNYENKWNDFKSDVKGVLGDMNTTMEKSIEHLNEKIEENADLQIKRIDTNTKDLSTAVERINVIDVDVAKLDVKYSESIKVMGVMNTTLNTNSKALSKVVERISTIDNDIALLDIKHDDVASKVRNLDSRTNEIDSVLKATEISIGSLTNRINDLHGVRHAFSVGLLSKKKYTHEDTIVFDSILHNSGGNYNISTGKFTVPKTGTYFFSFSVHGTKSHYAYGQIAFGQDNDYKHGAAAISAKGFITTTASATWIRQLSKGTKVWMQSLFQSEFYRIYTAFTGLLLD